ncbi:CKLF-like MARVEL transmembrane domain-containing protein 8b isoform X1 [Girardinichthys multiradiatus]|uniref:CKLF-like MARVEL transmembrane domain-containing protein 8b isoform X1 n=1 Tax=Girardinichthys multiradiatus TaxID=208333 RepID=UPI001FAC2873|nr:CKLF-like MARVEL transmembrane domain-containing protein 8b isoform X1 [Girardinichthys multiradiatus]
MDRTAVVPTRRGSSLPQFNTSTSTLAFDQHFTTNAKGILLLAEILSGMLVWILIGGTDYFHLSALCWVMFVAILLWILTICLLVIYLTRAHNRIPQIPWTTLCGCSVSGDSCGRCYHCEPGHQGTTQLQLLGSISILCISGHTLLCRKWLPKLPFVENQRGRAVAPLQTLRLPCASMSVKTGGSV